MDLHNKKVLITGSSRGIGRALTIKLVGEGCEAWGIARREKLLKNLKSEVNSPKNYLYSAIDISQKDSWDQIVKSLRRKKYHPDIVIFNAAIFENDFINGLDFEKTRKMIEINYLSVIKGIQALFPLLKTNSQVIAISSSSALKGSGEEGIGYAASKAALSIAFESLYLKYRNKIHFKTVFFGPVKTGMSPFSRHTILSLSEEDAVRAVIKSIERGDVISYYPLIIFYAYKLAKLLPSSYYFKFLTFIDEKIHQRLIVESDD